MSEFDGSGEVELTLALIKPDAFEKAAEIEARILGEGFSIVKRVVKQLSVEEAQEFYVDHQGKEFFNELVTFMSSGCIVVLALSRENAVKHWRYLLGPTNIEQAKEKEPDSIRALYGKGGAQNAAHGSDTYENAFRELQFFFPDMTLEDHLLVGFEDEEAHSFFRKFRDTLNDGLQAVCQARPEDPIIWLANWLQRSQPNRRERMEGKESQVSDGAEDGQKPGKETDE